MRVKICRIFALFVVPGFLVNTGTLCGQESGSVIAPDVFQFQPETAEDITEAVQITRKLDRPGDARAFLRRLLDQQGSPELAQLREKKGLADFVEFNSDPRLQPEARQVLKLMQSVLPETSSAELEAMVSALDVPGAAADLAEVRLITAGEAAVPFLLGAEPSSEKGRRAQKILSRYARDLRFALLKQLAAGDQNQQIRILNLLKGCDDRAVAVRLLVYQFSGDSADVQQAASEAIVHLNEGATLAKSEDEAVIVLLRSSYGALIDMEQISDAMSFRLKSVAAQSEQQSSANDETSDSEDTSDDGGENASSQNNPETAKLLMHATLCADDAEAINPDHAEIPIVRFLLSASQLSGGLGDIVDPMNAEQSLVLSALERTTEKGLWTIASKLLRVLRDNFETIENPERAASVLQKTLESPDGAVRGLTAIMVRQGWPVHRETLVQKVLAANAKAPARAEAVVVCPDSDERLRIAHVLEDHGFAVRTAGTGPDGFDAAASCMSCDLMILSAVPSKWPAPVTLSNLRSDARTQMTPVVLLCDVEQLEAGAILAKRWDRVRLLTRPIGETTMPSQLASLNLPSSRLSAADRAYLQEQSR